MNLGLLPIAALILLSGLFYGTASPLAVAEVIPIVGKESPPTQTLYWEGAGSVAVLVFIPGGEGQLNLKPTQVDVKNQFYQTLKQLSLGPEQAGVFDVVLFDSPARLDVNSKGYPSSRATVDHLSRIQSVIRFYKEKTHKPIWLMGHSNGAVSVTEFLRYEAKLGQATEISGLIVSGARKVAYFDSTPLDIPVLFMNHRKDACIDSDANVSIGNFKKVQGLDKKPAAFVFIETGRAEGKPCEAGFHMYNEATQEVVGALRNFIVPFTR